MKKKSAIVVLLLILLLLLLKFSGFNKKKETLPVETPIAVSTATVISVSTESVTPPSTDVKPKSVVKEPPKKEIKVEVPKKAPSVPPIATASVPPVQIHKELIPKNIEIVRVYYAQPLMAPGNRVEFDINGTGFNQEFEKMITVESGSSDVGIKDLKLVTPNQIHGMLVVSSVAETAVIFPQILIQGKVVFRAPDPFGVIRPGDVLNVVFTEMGDTGRSGRFRIFTNLTEDMFKNLSIYSSTPTIQVSNVTPQLPFVVDATIQIGPAMGGSYGLTVQIGDRKAWQKEGVIRIIQPNLGDTGLVQRLKANDGFYRPGDKAQFIVQGSGFQMDDLHRLKVSMTDFDKIDATFTYVAPGRLDMTMQIPQTATPKSYTVKIANGTIPLLSTDGAFVVVPSNWVRQFRLSPVLYPGSESVLYLEGRDLDKSFIGSIQVAVDEPSLEIGKFSWLSPNQASVKVKAGEKIIPGDYLLTVTSNGAPVQAQFGNIIHVSEKP